MCLEILNFFGMCIFYHFINIITYIKSFFIFSLFLTLELCTELRLESFHQNNNNLLLLLNFIHQPTIYLTNKVHPYESNCFCFFFYILDCHFYSNAMFYPSLKKSPITILFFILSTYRCCNSMTVSVRKR